MASKKVLKIFDDLKTLHEQKDADYAGDTPLSNFRRCEQFGIPAWKGVTVRMSDKWSRFVSLMGKDGAHEVAGESLKDTLLDLAAYAVITVALMDETEPCSYGIDNEGNRVKTMPTVPPYRYKQSDGWISSQEDISALQNKMEQRLKEAGS